VPELPDVTIYVERLAARLEGSRSSAAGSCPRRTAITNVAGEAALNMLDDDQATGQ